MGDWRDAARGDLAGLVELDRFAARGMVRGVHLGCEYHLNSVQATNTSGFIEIVDDVIVIVADKASQLHHPPQHTCRRLIRVPFWDPFSSFSPFSPFSPFSSCSPFFPLLLLPCNNRHTGVRGREGKRGGGREREICRCSLEDQRGRT
jgi:hypothetical protein